MLLPFFYTLRAYKIPIGTQEWLCLMEALSQNLADSNLEKFYILARAILVKNEALFDAYDQAFLKCFRDFSGQFNIKDEILDWLNKSLDPSSRPKMPQIDPLTLKELQKQFLERLNEQKEEHHGGSKWVGTGGTSPFGHSGAHPSGIRIGGPGGGRMAVKIAEERRFQNYRNDLVLNTRQLKVALRKLRTLKREGLENEINIEESIRATCKNAGDIELVYEAPRKNQTELLLIMDSGGSMDTYAHLAESLFSAAHASNHFKAFHYYYFHNCPYSKLYTNIEQNKWAPTEELFRKYSKNFFVIFVGDACMNPYELFVENGIIDYWQNEKESGITWLKRLRSHFPQSVWLNPEEKSYWPKHPTIKAISQLFPMFSLSLEGLGGAIEYLKRKDRKEVF